MKIFLDTADLSAIKYWSSTGIINGVTTNPTHLSKEKNNPTEHVLAICATLPDGIISVEVTETDPTMVYQQAKQIALLADNIIVKIPCHALYYETIKKLVSEGIALNITLVFSLSQGIMMAKLGAHYISPFIGRLDDAGGDGLLLVKELAQTMNHYNFSTHILAASIRNIHHFEGAIVAGVDAITTPVSVLEQVVEHQLTNQGMDQFLADWKTLHIKKFP